MAPSHALAFVRVNWVLDADIRDAYLHYVFDLWAHQWRRRHAGGDVIIVRYADDYIVGFQHQRDAQRFLADLRDRLARFGLELAPEKTRLIEFGRFAAQNRRSRGQAKPETFDFLGFKHICSKTKNGRFMLKRITIGARMQAKLREIKDELRRRRHHSIPDQGRWLGSVVRGHMAYYAVPGNADAMIDGYQYYCRECFRTYFRERGDLHCEQSNAAKRKRIAPGQALVRERLEGSSCADCGEDETAVLEFDHVGDKRDGVSRMMWTGASLAALQAELDRCEVVCVCCHRRRTARRANWPRWTGFAAPHWPVARRRKFEHVLDVLTFGGCVDCGERDPVVLDFDHLDGKTDTVARLLATQASWKRLKLEIAGCEVRCGNCHRLVTHVRRGGTCRGSVEWADADELTSPHEPPWCNGNTADF